MPTPPNKQNINIGIQSNDGTGDSIRDAFRKTNENFEVLFDYIGAGDGLRFTNLEDYGDSYKQDPDQTKRLGPGDQLVSTVVDTANTNGGVILVMRDVVAGLGMQVQFSNDSLTIINSTSTISTDYNPILGGDLKGTGQGYKDIAIGTGTETTSTFGTYAWRGKDFADPIADQDLVTRKYLYDNFLNRDGIYRTGTETVTTTTLQGSILRENIQLIPANSGTTSTNIGKYITIINSSGTTSTVDLTLQATSSTHITRKDYVDTKISLQGVDTIDPATGEVNPGFGKMTGPLILSRDPQTSDDFDYNGFIAATKQYVDKNDFFSDNNLFITSKGRDYQPDVPPVRRGRSPAYAFASLNKAAIYAEKLIATSRIEVGDYARLITYENGIAATIVDTTPNFYGNNLARLRLSVGSLGSDQFGAADVGQFTIFPGQYIEGVTSGAIALIENIAKGDNPGDPEVYSVAYVDYADDFDTAVVTSVPDFANPQRVKLTFSNAPQQIVPIPEFWIGYQFYTDTGIVNGTITEIESDVDNAGVYQNYFIVEWELGAPGASQTFAAADWHVYAGDFSPNETVVYNTNVSALQVTFVIESGEYYEQYPIKLAANTSIRGDEFRRVIIRPAPGVSSSRWANTYFRRDAQVDGLQSASLDYNTDYAQGDTLLNATAIPSGSSGVITISISTGLFPVEYKGYMFVGNGGQGIIDDATTGGFTVNLGTEMLNASEIPYGEWHIYKPIVFGYHYLRDPLRPMNLLVTQNNPGGLENAAGLLIANRNFIQEETIAYLDDVYVTGGSSTFTYDQTKCARDTGLIVDAIAQDVLFTTSSQSTFAGLQYWNQDGYVGAIAGELTTTTNAINYVKTLAQQIVTNTTGTRYQSTVTQNISLPAATAAQASDIGTDFDVITTILTAGTANVTDIIIPNSLVASTSTNVQRAYALLIANESFLKAEAVAYVESTKTVDFTYDQTKCARDVGYMVESVAFDLLYGGNRQAVQLGVYYYGFSGTSSAIPGESVQTRAAYNHLREILPQIVKGASVTNYQSTVTQITAIAKGTDVEGLAARSKIDIITGIIGGGPLVANDPTPIRLTASTSSNVINAAKIISANRSFIVAETIAYINSQLSNFVFDHAKCKRDVGLFVDSFAHDLVYGGSERSIYAGDVYKSISLVQSEETIQTAAAVAFIGTLSQQIITNTPISPLSTATQYINTATVAEATAGAVLADLTQATTRIVGNDPLYNPPKDNGELDVFLMNDANVIRYVSCQNHGGFMQVLDPEGQIKNKSPYTQTASSFSQSVNKQAFRGGMLVDGFSGNVEATPVAWDPINSPLSLDVTGLIRRPQVPTFFMNKGVRYEVDFFANFRQDGVDANDVPLYAATLRLNPLSPGGVPDSVLILDTVGGFKANQTDIPIIIEQPTGIGGLGATGHAETDSTGYITAIVIDFPGTGYTSTPFLNIGGAILNNLTIVASGVTNATLVTGGYGYAVGCRIEIIPIGIIGGVSAKGTVTAVDGNGTILAFTITTPGSGWNSSVGYRVAFGGVDITVPTPSAGFLDTVPAGIELVTAGNRSMLANDFTQVNDLGYGIFVTNGGFMENVSMFTYYCYRSYFALNGSQVRTLTGSSVYGEYGLVADGKDPTEVPLSLNNVFPMVQLATAYVNNPLFPAQVGQTYIYVTIDSLTGGYPPLNGSIVEINHGGVRQNYSVGSASPALNSSNELIPNTYQLFFNTGNISVGTSGLGLLTAVNNGDPIIIRSSTLVKVNGFNPVSISRPSTSLTWDDDPTYVYHITGFSTVQPDGSVYAYTQEDYNYITFQAVDQGVVHPTLISGGTGYSNTNTVINISGAGLVSGTTQTINGDQGGGTIGIQTLVMNNVAGVVVGQKVSTSTYILTDTFVTYVNATTKQICLSNPTNGFVPDGTSLAFTASSPVAHATISSGTITSVVIDGGGAGWNTADTSISIVGGDGSALVATPVTIAGVAGSSIVKITTLDLTSQNRIRQGLVASPQKLYQFAHGDTIYQITGYRTPSSKGVAFEVAIVNDAYYSVAVSASGTGYSLNQPLTILGTQLGGTSPENDLTLLVTSVNSSGGVLAVSFTGTSITGTISFVDVSPPDGGQTSAEIDVYPPLTEAISKGTILRAGIPIFSKGSLTTKISILRATGHDFVDIGTGGYASTRIPNDLYGPPLKQRNASNEVIQVNRGRVYYVTTDQDGNFRVGDALTVNQAQGSVTISVPLDLSNLSSLSLRRDLGPPVNEFSIDSTMVTEADYKVPTEQAVANYVNRRLGLDRNGNIYAGSPLGPQFLALDGQLAMKADLNMGYTHRIIHLQTPTVSTDASTKGYTDTKISNAGTAAVDVNGTTLLPDWGRMTGSLQLYNDPIVKTAVVATTASLNATRITFEDLTLLGVGGYQPGDFFYSRINGIGIPEGTIVTTVDQDNVSLGLGDPITGNNVAITQAIPPGTVITFDPINQAANKRYVDIQNQFSKLNDVTLTNAADVDLVMFNSTVLPVSTSTNPPLYESTRQVVNVANDTNTISNTPTSRAGGSDITIERPTANAIRIKLVGGAGALNPVTDYHINDNAQIQQAKLFMTTATTAASAPTGGQRPQQASLGVAQFTSLSFKATNGWIELKDATSISDGVQTIKHAWVPTGGGLLGATNTAANTSATYVTSATVKTWLGNESSAWNFSSDLIPRIDNTYNVGNASFRWKTVVANTATLDGGLILNTASTISGNQTTANVFNTGVTTGNLYSAGTTVRIGGTSGTLTLGNPTVVGTQGSQDLFNTVATTLNIGGAATTLTLGNATGATATLRPGTLVGSNTTQVVFDTVATTVNAFGAATTLTLGNATGATATLRPGTLVGSNTTQNVFNTVATTVNAFGAATTLSLGAASGTTTINNNLAADNITDNGNRVITSVDWSSGSGISISSETTTGPSAAATINNTGVLSMAASNGLSVDVSTGNVTVTSNATSANTANAIVSRNASGNFSAGTITATLSGTSTGFPAGTVAEIGRYLDFHSDAGAQFDYDVRLDGQAGASAGAGLLIMSGTGGFYCTGNITANYSDDRLKTKLGKIENALDKICSLEGFYYEPNQTAQDLGYLVKREVGVSAQSTQASMPEIVVPAPIDNQYLTVQYDKFAPFIIEAIKELRAEVEAIKKALK